MKFHKEKDKKLVDEYTWLKNYKTVKELGKEAVEHPHRDNFRVPSMQLVPMLHREKINPKYKSVYLAGPMEGCSYDEAANWREEAATKLAEYGIDARNPMIRDFRDAFANGDGIDPDEVVIPDKMDILQSDAILVWYSQKSTGTAMEMLYAYYWHIPIVVVEIKKPANPWIDYHADYVCENLEDAVGIIRQILNKG